jgi:RNA polymerase sigma-70 factor (ECF subfamily)
MNNNIDISSLKQIIIQAAERADMDYYVKEINKQIGKIDAQQRIPFEMFLDGYQYKEIADKMNISMGTVKSRIFFARKKLQNILSDYIH